MSEDRRSAQNTESDESGLLLSVEPTSERSLDFAALSDDTDKVDTVGDTDGEDTVGDSDGEDTVGDTDGADAADTDATDDADGTD